jgi:hypothetical protein
MSERQIGFEKLNAYVDGELDAAGAAEVARAVAEDPGLAREVAALTRLRSAVAESVEAPPLGIDLPRSDGGRRAAIAACAALVMFIAASVLVSDPGRDRRAEWLARSWQIHRDWSVDAAAAQSRPASLNRFRRHAPELPGAYVPDLSASRLSLVHSVVTPFTGSHKALLAGYRGTRGCKISLLIFPSVRALGEALSFFSTATTRPTAGRRGSWGTSSCPTAWTATASGCWPKAFARRAANTCSSTRRRAWRCAKAATSARPARPDRPLTGKKPIDSYRPRNKRALGRVFSTQ